MTKYYNAGVAQVENVGGTLSYLVGDALGSVSMALSSGGSVQSAQLFTPYGFTGHRIYFRQKEHFRQHHPTTVLLN